MPANIVHPGAKMYRNQPVTDGPAGPDRTRRPVGTDGMHAVHDVDRPTAGGPVGRVFNLDPLGPGRMSSPDELNQPLAMGPLGTDGIHAVDDSDRPTAGGPVGRLFSLDPMGPSGMLSLDEWNQPPAVGPVGKPSITGPLGNQGSESDCRRTIQLRSESESSTGVPDPGIQTGSDVQTDRMNIGTANGQAGSSDTPPSSNSGVHSLGEQWENMSTNSMDMESEQNGGDPGQLGSETSRPLNTEEGVRFDCPWTDCVLEKKPVGISSLVRQREDREAEFNKVTICVNEHIIVYSGTDDRNSDIAAMSDFCDDEDEAQEESRPGPRTGSDRDGSVEEASNLCDRPINNTVTAGDGRDSLDPNDMEYCTKFRRLTRQTFLLDDDCLSDSNYPNSVKDVVRRSRLTIMALDEYDAPPFEQRTDGGTPGCSDGGDIMDSDDSESIRIPMLEQRTDGGTPGCSDWEDIMESDDSERGDSEVRTNWPYEMRTFTPPPPPPMEEMRPEIFKSEETRDGRGGLF